MAENEEKIAIILASGDLEKLQAAGMIGSVAAVSGINVELFISMEALTFFTKDAVAQKNFKTGPLGAEIVKKGVSLYPELIEQGKMMGNLKVYACAMVLDVMGWEKEDLIDIFDDVIGVTAFLSKASGAAHTLFI